MTSTPVPGVTSLHHDIAPHVTGAPASSTCDVNEPAPTYGPTRTHRIRRSLAPTFRSLASGLRGTAGKIAVRCGNESGQVATFTPSMKNTAELPVHSIRNRLHVLRRCWPRSSRSPLTRAKSRSPVLDVLKSIHGPSGLL